MGASADPGACGPLFPHNSGSVEDFPGETTCKATPEEHLKSRGIRLCSFRPFIVQVCVWVVAAATSSFWRLQLFQDVGLIVPMSRPLARIMLRRDRALIF